MSKVRIAYISLLIVLAVLFIFTVFRPMAVGSEYSEVQREKLLRAGDEWIFEFDIMNHEGRDINYDIEVFIDNRLYKQPVLILDGRKFTYIHHIRHDQVRDNDVSFTIYKEDEATPIKQATYHLK